VVSLHLQFHGGGYSFHPTDCALDYEDVSFSEALSSFDESLFSLLVLHILETSDVKAGNREQGRDCGGRCDKEPKESGI
jgi:hypothetical protein